MKARLQSVSRCVVAALTLLAGAEPGLAYARTDIGGVYRRDADRGR